MDRSTTHPTARGRGNIVYRLAFRGAGLPRAALGGAINVESREHADRGRRIPRADFARAAPIPQFENRFAMPGAASGGARPLNNARRTVWDQVMKKIQFR